MLESPTAMKEKTVKEELFQLLGLLVKKYNQTLSELHTSDRKCTVVLTHTPVQS